MKKTDKLLSVLLALCLLLALVPAAAISARATAGTPATKVRIAGVEQELTNGSQVNGKYIFRDGVLNVMNNVDGAMYQFDATNHRYAAIWANGDLTIELDTIDTASGGHHICGAPGEDAAQAYGIYVDGDLTIQSGSGLTPKFLVRSSADESSLTVSHYAVGIYCTGKLTVNNTGGGLEVAAYGNSDGVYAQKGVSITGATVEAHAGTQNSDNSVYSYGLYAGGPLEISSQYAFGQLRHEGTLKGFGGTISRGHSCGVCANGGLFMQSGVIEGEGGSVAGTGFSCGVELDGKDVVSRVGVTETGAASGYSARVTAVGGACGDASYGLYQNNGTLEAGGAAELTLSIGEDAAKTASSGSYALFGTELSLSGNAKVDARIADSNNKSNWAVFLQTALTCSDNAELTAVGGDGTYGSSYGLIVGTLTMNGGSVTARSGGRTQKGGACVGVKVNTALNMNGGALTAVSGDMAPTSGSVCNSYGMHIIPAEINITGGMIDASAGKAGQASFSYGVYLGEGENFVNVTGGKLAARGYQGAFGVNSNSSNYTYTVDAPILVGGANRDGEGAALGETYDKSWKYAELDASRLLVEIEDWGVGEASNAPQVYHMDKYGDGTLTADYAFTQRGRNDYSRDVPTEAGKYTVRATLTEKLVGYADFVVCGVTSADVADGVLTWCALLPMSDTAHAMIAAWYDASGKMLGCAVQQLACTGEEERGAFTVPEATASYRLMLVDGATFAPLCETWDGK